MSAYVNLLWLAHGNHCYGNQICSILITSGLGQQETHTGCGGQLVL